MARTSSQYFEYRKNLLGATGAPTPLKVLVANTTTIKVGQMARVNTAGLAVPAGVGDAILGPIVGIVDNDNIPVNAFGYTGATGHTNSGDDTVVTASNNSTRARAVYAEILASLGSELFYNDASGALAQTNLFQFFDLDSDADQVDQGTASDTSGQVQLIALDPDEDGDTSKGLFRVSEPQLLSYHANATAVNEA